MATQKIYETQTNFRLHLRCNEDIGSNSTVVMKVKKPNGSIVDIDATVEDSTIGLFYIDFSSIVDEFGALTAGKYIFWGGVNFEDNTYAPTTTVKLEIHIEGE